jgi:LasA protease
LSNLTTRLIPRMNRRSKRSVLWLPFLGVALLLIVGLACALSSQGRPDQTTPVQNFTDTPAPLPSATPMPTSAPATLTPPPTTDPLLPRPTPTPDQVRPTPEIRDYYESHVVGYGDTLNAIAYRYGVGVQQIQQENNISDPNILSIGVVLSIPPPIPQPPGPARKLIPDSELVYGPAAANLEDIFGQIGSESYLRYYVEVIDGQTYDGLSIVQKVAESYSINPRILLAVLNQQSGWVEDDVSHAIPTSYPIGWYELGREGLFSQLSWAANELNRGFYRWKSGWAGPYVFSDGQVVPPGPGINAGTVALQHLFSRLYSVETWRDVVGEYGFAVTYESLFGDPFRYSVEPLIPDSIEQPQLELPFEKDRYWSFTGGPHSAYGSYAAWAALDFAPPGNVAGCIPSNEWVVAAANGKITWSADGLVVQDLSGDGIEQTGWSLIYLHIETRDRVEAGIYLQEGDRIGHPSCEGGISTGTHVHLARKYNGVWIEAAGETPFNLGGWIAASSGSSYEGTLTRGDETLLACACRASYNQISH